MDGEEGDGVFRSEKLQAITALDVKQPLPVIRDDDAALDKHNRDFDDVLQCYEFGGKRLRNIDRLQLYGRTFPAGSTRLKVYDNIIRRARTAKRLPQQAAEVLVEIRQELTTYIWETVLQKMTRLDGEFDRLVQGNLSHADFRALFESKLMDMEDSGMDMPTEQTMFRKYLSKIDAEMRVRVMSKEWKIDGPNLPPRSPKTLSLIHI